jgi:hypothetical protein
VADLSDIPDEAVMDAAKDGYARWVGAEDWQSLVRKIGTRDAAAAAQVIRPALAAALPVLNTAKANEDFAGFYMTNDDGYPALTYYPNEDDDGVHVRSADAGTSLAELIGAARKHAASLRGEQ